MNTEKNLTGNVPEKYKDIIHLPRPVSNRRAHMPIPDRAKIFSPFAALKGYEEELEKTQENPFLP